MLNNDLIFLVLLSYMLNICWDFVHLELVLEICCIFMVCVREKVDVELYLDPYTSL